MSLTTRRRQREHRRTLQPIPPHRPHPKLQIILGQIHRHTPPVHRQTPLPLHIPTRPPHQLIPRHQLIVPRVPAELRVVREDFLGGGAVCGGEADGCGDGDVAGQGRRVGRRPHARQVRAGDARGVVEVDVFDEVAVLGSVLDAGVLISHMVG